MSRSSPRSTTGVCGAARSCTPGTGAPRLVTARDLDVSQFESLYGLFRSRRAALEALREIANAHGLCHVLLGLEKRKGPCFAHQIGRCRGACAGRESREIHALRLAQALAGLRMRPWPYRGRIGVRETVPGGGRSELIVLDRWCYLGTARSEQELHELAASRAAPLFDLDTYGILTRFLDKPRRNCAIIELAGRSLSDPASTNS